MPRPKALSDHELIAARWEYETTPISARQLAVKYSCSKSTMATLAQPWKKVERPRSYHGEDGQRAYQRDVKAAIRAAYDQRLIEALKTRLTLPPAGNWTPGTNQGNPMLQPWHLDPDGPQSSQNPPRAQPQAEPPRPVTDNMPAEIVQFPNRYRAKRDPPPRINGQVPSQTEAAAARVHLATLRGQLAIEQIARLDKHEQLLDDITHLASVFVAPARHVDVSNLSEEEAGERLEAVSRAAARIILPTERDTLLGLIGTLNKATLAAIQAKRVVAGLPAGVKAGGEKGDAESGQGSPVRSLKDIATAELREIKRAMDVLQGHNNSNSDAPKPPPPDPIDHLVDEELQERAG